MDYIGDVDHASSGKPCIQWNLIPFSENRNRYRLRFHNKCRNVGYGHNSLYGAFCYVTSGINDSGEVVYSHEPCTQIPGISFAPVL